MHTPKRCRDCDATLAPTSAGELCPACLFRVAQDSDTIADPASHASAPICAPNGPSGSPLSSGAQLRYFGDYEIKDELARGGMGVVYRARQVSLNRPVAIKMILSGQLASERDVRRFHMEAEAVANLQHPHIVAIHEVGEHAGLHYFSMDLIEGEDLSKTLRRGAMNTRDAATLVRKISLAVAYAHRHGILHRDLKPSNILIGPDGEPRITDFGLAKRQEAASGLTLSGAVLGTPSYMAPEQAEGRLEEIDRRTDVFGLGAILYETIAGQAPFLGDNPMAILKQVVEHEPDPPSRRNPAVPRDLEAVCLKCLQKNAANRYQTATELADDLDRFLRHEPVLARPPARFMAWMDWLRKNPWTVTTAASLALFALCVGMFTFWDYSRFLLWKSNHPGSARASVEFFDFLDVTGYDGLPPFVMLFAYLMFGPAALVAGFASRKTTGKLPPKSLVLFLGCTVLNLGLAMAAMLRFAHCQIWAGESKEFLVGIGLLVLSGVYFSLHLLGLVARELKVWRFGERGDEARAVYGTAVVKETKSKVRGFRRSLANLTLFALIMLAVVDALTSWVVVLSLVTMAGWGAFTYYIVTRRRSLLAALTASKVSLQLGIFLIILTLPIYSMLPLGFPNATYLTLQSSTAAYLSTFAAALLGACFAHLWFRFASASPEVSILEQSRLRQWGRKRGKGMDFLSFFIWVPLYVGAALFQPMAVVPSLCAGAAPRGIILFFAGDTRLRFGVLGTTCLASILACLAFFALPHGIFWALTSVGFTVGCITVTAYVWSLPKTLLQRRGLLWACLVIGLSSLAGLLLVWSEVRALPLRQKTSMQRGQLQQIVQLVAFQPAAEVLTGIRELYSTARLHDDGVRYFEKLANSPSSTEITRFMARWQSALLLEGLHRTNQSQTIFGQLIREHGLLDARQFRLSPSYVNEKNKGFGTPYPPELAEPHQVPWARPAVPSVNFQGFLNLRKHFSSQNEPTEHRLAYARLEVISDRDAPILLTTGSDDDLAAWWNGQRVARKNYSRQVALDSDVVFTHIKKGTNVLLAKVCNREAEWGLLVRITDRNGKPLEGLSYVQSQAGFNPTDHSSPSPLQEGQ